MGLHILPQTSNGKWELSYLTSNEMCKSGHVPSLRPKHRLKQKSISKMTLNEPSDTKGPQNNCTLMMYGETFFGRLTAQHHLQ